MTDLNRSEYVNYGTDAQTKLTDVKPGQYFGEMAIIEARPRSTTIVRKKSYMCLKSRKMN